MKEVQENGIKYQRDWEELQSVQKQMKDLEEEKPAVRKQIGNISRAGKGSQNCI